MGPYSALPLVFFKPGAYNTPNETPGIDPTVSLLAEVAMPKITTRPSPRPVAEDVSRPDLCVFIGRFSPLHKGHETVIQKGLNCANKMLVLVGSAFEARSHRNPFTVAERMDMISATFFHPNLLVRPLENSSYNLNEWIERVHTAVAEAWAELRAADPSLPAKPQVALIGHSKDESSYYLNLFPLWRSINVPQEIALSATSIRENLFGSAERMTDLLDEAEKEDPITKKKMSTAVYLSKYLPQARAQALAYLEREAKDVMSVQTIAFLKEFVIGDAFQAVGEEFAFVARYRYSWRLAPYAPTFLTADAVVVQSGHILLVKRKAFPGKGLWALPGGFVERNDTIENTVFKELEEETGIRVPQAVLRGHVKAKEVFDDPHRSSRGRTVTTAYLIHLKPGPLPKTKKGGLVDDEETLAVQWVPLVDLKREDFFEDHYSIITNMVKRI